jgi:uncharacterized small protein (DUF1192 family)
MMLIASFVVAYASLVQQQFKEHPATKIITLLQGLQVQIKEEGQEETHLYGKFTYWCTETIKDKEKSVKEYEETISVATSTIQALTEDIAALETELEALEKELEKDTASKATMGEERDAANGLYMDNKADLESTIDAVASAITALEASKPAFLQQNWMKAPAVQKALGLLMAYSKDNKVVAKITKATEEQPGDPNADKFEDRKGRENTYSFKGGDVIEMLKTLKLQFEDQLKELNSAEASASNAHKLSDAAKEDEIQAAERAKETKTEVKGAKGSDLSTAESTLSEATSSRDADTTVLDETKQLCGERKEEYEKRMKTRADEIEAMGKAIEILSKVTGVRTPESKGISLIQISKKISDPKAAIVNLLRKAGSSKQTAALEKLAEKIAALKQTPGSGTFDQIKNMIQKMIFHLMAEQKDEDDHKNWCDKEIATTTMMIEDKETKRDTLQASIDVLTQEIADLKVKITENQEAVALMNTEIEEETAERQAEKAENTATIKDAQDAQTAVSEAIAVLSEFYKGTGMVEKEAWELNQMHAHVRRIKAAPGETAEPEPELFEPGYKGSEEGAGVIGMLEEIAQNFALMETGAKADETEQSDEYEKWMTDTKISISEKEQDTQMKTARMERQKEKLVSKTDDFKHNKKELEATLQYEADLQHACVDGDSTYEDRKAARTKEIEALKEAQDILEKAFDEPAGEEEAPPAF